MGQKNRRGAFGASGRRTLEPPRSQRLGVQAHRIYDFVANIMDSPRPQLFGLNVSGLSDCGVSFVTHVDFLRVRLYFFDFIVMDKKKLSISSFMFDSEGTVVKVLVMNLLNLVSNKITYKSMKMIYFVFLIVI